MTRAGAPIPGLVSAKAHALLVFLALTRRQHTRETLAGLLWSEQPEEEARANLRQVLSQLRRLLGDHVQAGRLSVTFNRSLPYRLDVDDFLEAVRELHPESDSACLQTAFDLYRGDLLTGFSIRGAPAFDEWLVTQREYVRQVAVRGLRSLADAYAGRRDDVAAAQALKRMLTLDPLSEDAHRQLMRLLAGNGQRTAALAQYATLRRLLAEELDAEPETGTTELAEAIRAGTITRPPTPPAQAAPEEAGRQLNNLPVQMSSFVGREAELAELRRIVPTTRLLTLTGPGGCGKTRLALELVSTLLEDPLTCAAKPNPGLAALVSDGTWLVELASVADAGMVAQAVAAALSVREASGQPLLATLGDALRARHLLLLLDNCEHVLPACAGLARSLLRACPGLRIVATSRQALGLAGEVIRPVPPLESPPVDVAPAELTRYAAARLFLERAVAVAQGLSVTAHTTPAVALICRQLDGLPLALELAAARVPGLGVHQIAARIDQLRMQTGGSSATSPRQRTLRATIAWSHDLLTPAEAVLFRRMAVFAGGWTLEAIEAVCTDDQHDARLASGLDAEASAEASFVMRRVDVLPLLLALVDRSLVAADMRTDGLARYRSLETIREYAMERLLASGEGEIIRARHAAVYGALAASAAQVLDTGPDHGEWLDRLEVEQDNLLEALRWVVEQGDVEHGWGLGAVLATVSIWRGYATAARAQLAPLMALARAECSPDVQLIALQTEAELAFHQADYALAVARHEDRLALSRSMGQQRIVVGALNDLGHALREGGDHAGARQRLEESLTLARAAGDRHGMAVALDLLGTIAHALGDYAVARVRYRDSLDIAAAAGDQLLLAWTPFNLGCLALDEGNFEEARARLAESLGVWRARRATDGIIHALAMLASLAAADDERALESLRLAAATTALSEASGCPLAPFYRGRFEHWIRVAQQATSSETAAEVWAAGRLMNLEQAVTAAMATCDRETISH